jgi:hypothetical protein
MTPLTNNFIAMAAAFVAAVASLDCIGVIRRNGKLRKLADGAMLPGILANFNGRIFWSKIVLDIAIAALYARLLFRGGRGDSPVPLLVALAVEFLLPTRKLGKNGSATWKFCMDRFRRPRGR